METIHFKLKVLYALIQRPLELSPRSRFRGHDLFDQFGVNFALESIGEILFARDEPRPVAFWLL